MIFNSRNLLIILNFVLAFVYIFIGLNLLKLALYPLREDPLVSQTYSKAEIVRVLPNSYAERIGLKEEDKIIDLNGSKIDISNRLKTDSISELQVLRDNTHLTINPDEELRQNGELFGIEYKITPQELTWYELLKGHLNYLTQPKELKIFAPMTIFGMLHAVLAYALHKKSKSILILTLSSLILFIIFFSNFLYKGVVVLHIFSILVTGFLLFNYYQQKQLNERAKISSNE